MIFVHFGLEEIKMADKIVDFQWCKLCKYMYVDESDSPCHECLNSPVNEDSHRPTEFVEKSAP